MTEILGEGGQLADSPDIPASLLDHSPRHLGRYPVRLPTPSDPRLLLAAVTLTLQVLGQTVFDFNVSIAQILITIAVCGLIDVTLTLRGEHVIAWPASGLLTGNGIALILRVPTTEYGDWWSLQGWWIFVGAGVLAMASKYLIRVKGRHIFNPSNFALVVVFVVLGQNRVDPQVLWWGPLSAGLVLAFAVILGGSVVITRRVGQGASALSYWAVFAVAVALIAATGHSITANWHVGPISGLDYWVLLVTSPEVLVFLFFMITDPKTAPSERRAQIIYGTAIAVVGALIISTQTGEFGTKVGILAGLTVVSPFVGLIRARAPWWAATRHFMLRVTVAVSVWLAVAMVLASTGGVPRVEVATGDGHRAAFPVDMDELPTVEIDPEVGQSAVGFDQITAREVVHDAVQDLFMEASALEDLDPDLAKASLTSGRLDATLRAISESTSPNAQISYEFDALTATVAFLDDSPQAPPRLAAHMTGRISIGDATEVLDAVYVTTERDGQYLISRAQTPDGELLPPPLQPTVSDDREQIAPALVEAPPNSPGAIPEPWTSGDPGLGGLQFTEVSSESGLTEDFSSRELSGVEDMSSGAAVADVDRDGDQDLFIPRMGRPDSLYVNDGSGRFIDVATQAGLTGPDDRQGSTKGVFADVDADGDLDLFVTGAGTRRHMLYLNDGDTTFTEAARQHGLVWPDNAESDVEYPTHDSVFADFDNDGDLDLLVLQWWHVLSGGEDAATLLDDQRSQRVDNVLDTSACARSAVLRADEFPVADSAGENRSGLYLNDGSGYFEEVTDEVGLPLEEIEAFTGVFNDLDGDGWQDLLITGDYCTSRLFRNREGKAFEDVTHSAGVGTDENGMGSVVSDLNGDGLADWFVTSISYPSDEACPTPGCSGNRVYLNRGDLSFTDATDELGLRDSGWGWGAAIADFNNDGFKEVVANNGFRSPSFDKKGDPNDPQLNYLKAFGEDRPRFWVQDGSTFRDAAAAVGIDDISIGHGLVPFDMDGDGDLDLLMTPSNGPPKLYRNDTPPLNHWLRIELDDRGAPGNPWSEGTRIEVTPSAGVSPVTDWISTGGSYESQKPPQVHIGLGEQDGPVEEIKVFWPGEDQPQVISGVQPDQTLIVSRSPGQR